MNGGAAPAWRAWALPVLLAPVAGWVLWQAQAVLRADWASAPVRKELAEWVSGAAAPKTGQAWLAAQSTLQGALTILPDSPDLHERMGDLEVVAGQRDWADEALRRAHFARASASYLRAIELRPSEPQSWAALAMARQAAGEGRASVNTAWERAVVLGPYEGHVQPMLMQVVLADWGGASPRMQAWANSLFDDGNAATRQDINALAARYGLRFEADKDSVAPPGR